jgi:hypothetical protein
MTSSISMTRRCATRWIFSGSTARGPAGVLSEFEIGNQGRPRVCIRYRGQTSVQWCRCNGAGAALRLVDCQQSRTRCAARGRLGKFADTNVTDGAGRPGMTYHALARQAFEKPLDQLAKHPGNILGAAFANKIQGHGQPTSSHHFTHGCRPLGTHGAGWFTLVARRDWPSYGRAVAVGESET